MHHCSPLLTLSRISPNKKDSVHGLNGLDPSLFTYAKEFRPLRSNHCYKLNVKSARINSYKYSLFVRITEQWNDLPKVIAEANNLESFKSKLKKHILN